MPRLARLDAPGMLHHVMIRGTERRKIFKDDMDREDILERLSILLPETKYLLCMGIHVQSYSIPLVHGDCIAVKV